MIRPHIADLARDAISAAQAAGELPPFEVPQVELARPQKPEWGDYSLTLPLKLAAVVRRPPLQIAEAIARHVAPDPALEKVAAAAPGYVNFTLASEWLAGQVAAIRAAGANFGNLDLGKGWRYQVEFVSANPTGPLHIGGARNAAIGDTLARVLQAAGYRIEREYYINDAGSQIRHFGESVYARYAQAAGMDVPLPEDGYKGAYVSEMARGILQVEGTRYLEMPREEAVRALGRLATDMVLEDVRTTLKRMRVEFDSWFSEKSLYDSSLFSRVLKILQDKDLLYEKDGAVWFRGTRFGLAEDAVLIRSPETIPDPAERPTYLASDIAYVWNKLVERGFDHAIYVWGAGHHGNVPRVLAAVKALGLDPSRVTILLYQNVQITRRFEKVTMSKRSGEFVSLREVLDEVGADPVRFMLISRSADSPMDFDLQLAKEESEENPVYYVQYAHARIASILRNAKERGVSSEGANLKLLTHPAELDLIRQMLHLEEVVELAALRYEPHHLPHYALQLASSFHQFYKHCRVLSSEPGDAALTKARLELVQATKQVLARSLGLMGVSAPEAM